MFKKLLKHDFQSLKRIGIPLLILVLISTVVISVFVATVIPNDYGENVEVFEIVFTVFVAFSVLAILATPLILQIMVYENFYRTLTTDEGYLTFTLPVKAKEIIFSKLTNGVIWTLISGAAVFVSVIIIAVVAILATGDGSFGSTTVIPSDEPVQALTVISVILGIILSIASYFATQLVYFIIIFCGSTMFKIKKSSNIIWLLILGNFIISTASGTLSSIVTAVGSVITNSTGNYELGTTVTLSILTLFAGGLMVGAFFLLKYIMEKKINLP